MYFYIDLADVVVIVNWKLFDQSLIIFRLILELRRWSEWKEGLALNAMKAINNMLNYLCRKRQYTLPNMRLRCEG